MKTASDPRHKQRVTVIKEIFSWSFQKSNKKKTKKLVSAKIAKNLKKIDKIIVSCAPQFPLEQINRIDLAILRLSIWELVVGKTAPFKVIIDEAVELAKKFSSEKSPQFINGVLGTVIKEYGK